METIYQMVICRGGYRFLFKISWSLLRTVLFLVVFHLGECLLREISAKGNEVTKLLIKVFPIANNLSSTSSPSQKNYQ